MIFSWIILPFSIRRPFKHLILLDKHIKTEAKFLKKKLNLPGIPFSKDNPQDPPSQNLNFFESYLKIVLATPDLQSFESLSLFLEISEVENENGSRVSIDENSRGLSTKPATIKETRSKPYSPSLKESSENLWKHENSKRRSKNSKSNWFSLTSLKLFSQSLSGTIAEEFYRACYEPLAHRWIWKTSVWNPSLIGSWNSWSVIGR